MSKYIDGFAMPIAAVHLQEYKKVAEQVAEIWKEYGAIDYFEFVGDDMFLQGTLSFVDAVKAGKDELVIFGWAIFPSKEVRDSANQQVPKDPRMSALVQPLMNPNRMIFDAQRMAYGGFKPLVG